MLQTELSKIQTSTREDCGPASTSTSSVNPPAQKKIRTSLFAHYATKPLNESDDLQYERRLLQYLDTINSASFNSDDAHLSTLCHRIEFQCLQPMFERILAAPASSALVERVFSQSGLLVRPHRAKMSDTLLENLMFLKCNMETLAVDI